MKAPDREEAMICTRANMRQRHDGSWEVIN
jgi:hypothetical protein